MLTSCGVRGSVPRYQTHLTTYLSHQFVIGPRPRRPHASARLGSHAQSAKRWRKMPLRRLCTRRMLGGNDDFGGELGRWLGFGLSGTKIPWLFCIKLSIGLISAETWHIPTVFLTQYHNALPSIQQFSDVCAAVYYDMHHCAVTLSFTSAWRN